MQAWGQCTKKHRENLIFNLRVTIHFLVKKTTWGSVDTYCGSSFELIMATSFEDTIHVWF